MSAKRRAQVKERKVVRAEVLKLDNWRCRACQRGYERAAAESGHPLWWLVVNEHPPRSLGGDPTDLKDCLTLCETIRGDGCHQRYHAGRLVLEVLDAAKGCRGPVRFTEGDRSWES